LKGIDIDALLDGEGGGGKKSSRRVSVAAATIAAEKQKMQETLEKVNDDSDGNKNKVHPM